MEVSNGVTIDLSEKEYDVLVSTLDQVCRVFNISPNMNQDGEILYWVNGAPSTNEVITKEMLGVIKSIHNDIKKVS